MPPEKPILTEQTFPVCGAVSPYDQRIVCEKPKGHGGAHVCVDSTGTYAWGGVRR